MASIKIAGDTSGEITVSVPSVAGTNTLTLPANTGNIVTTGDSGTITEGMIGDGEISQAKLASGVVGNGPVFSAYASSQTISSSTPTNITYANEEFDIGSCFNNTGGTVTLNGLSVPAYAFCPNVAGYYQINGQVTYNSTASSRYAYIFIRKNGSAHKQGSFSPLNSSDYVAINVQAVVYLNGTGDYVQIYSGQNSTGSVGTIVSGVSYVHFSGVMVRSA